MKKIETTKERIKRIAAEYTNIKIDKAILRNELEALVLSAEVDAIENFYKQEKK